ncbi:SRPBCC family protein, partial [Sphingomonas bacterium]|uniref:SRPBCC family protein n=1 Tax=Sphingomonas bacterium TaxID=1895847 RepID=UPI00157642DF
AAIRIAAAVAAALAFSWGVYALLSASRPDTGAISFAFLLVLPAAVCGFVAYVADPWKTRSHRAYLAVPLWLLAAVVVLSLAILREGVICVLLLSPLWIVSGLIGAEVTYRLRRRVRDRAYCLTLFALPLVAMQVEPYVPVPVATPVVTRSIVIHASPAQLWPLMKGIPDVHPGEGGWNLTQDVIGVPRPLGARLVGGGVGADRYARWEHGIRFRERITRWAPGRALSWRFLFDDLAGWGYTDEHLLPNRTYFTVTDGGYDAAEIAPGVTRLTLRTRYRLMTPVNPYARAWGELFLGDLETNLLALVKHRAEMPRRRERAG